MEGIKKAAGKFFSAKELECKCGGAPLSCSTPDFCDKLLEDLDAIREEWGQPLYVTSASRCKMWNKKVGGSRNSMHMKSKAVDIKMYPRDYIKFIALVYKKAKHIKGIGLGIRNGFIHLDTREGASKCWGY